MEKSATKRWADSKLVIALQVTIAALCFMAITQLTQTIATRGLALLGLRTDAPMIIRINGCNKTIDTTPAATNADIDAPTEAMRARFLNKNRYTICADSREDQRVEVTATAPSGQPVSLLVNGGLVETRATAAATIVFDGVVLRPGDNIIAVAAGAEASAVLRFESGSPSYRQTSLGLFPIFPLGEPIQLTVGKLFIENQVIGGWRTPSGPRLLVSGAPQHRETLPDSNTEVSFDDGGFAVAAVSALPSGTLDLTEKHFRRSAKLTRLRDGAIQIEADACLPKDSLLAQWAVKKYLPPTDFIRKLTGIRLEVARGGVDNRAVSSLTVEDGPLCRNIHAEIVAPSARYPSKWGDFPIAPTDSLTLVGFETRLNYSRPPSEVSDEDNVTFRGGATDQNSELRIDPDYSRFNSEFNQRFAPPNVSASAPSKLATAWRRAELNFPSWLRALLSGVAAVAPILLLIASIQRSKRSDDPTYAAGKGALPGFYALLLLALAVVAQPLFFQLYYSVSQGLGVWGFLGDTRADDGPNYLDPYAPMALGISLMLIPFLRSAQGSQSKKRTLWLGVSCALGAVIGIVTLLTILLLQASPWIDPTFDKVVLSKILPHAALPPDAVLPLTLAAVVVGLAFAWIPLFWAFRVISSGPSFFGAIIIAGLSTILLPMASYTIEAIRVLIETPDRDYADGKPSLVSLVGAALLPLLLFYILLKAFREIAVVVVPAEVRPLLLRYGRDLNLFAVAVLLTLPRLILDRASASPAEMGVIEVLGIFQSFGLVIAAIAAIAFLTSRTSQVATDGTKVFAFQPEEITLLCALYAGYLSLWTSETLATAIAIIVGWMIFRYMIIDNAKLLPTQLASADMASQLIKARQDSALFAARQKAMEDRFSKGDDNFAALESARAELNNIRTEYESNLGIDLKEAKRRLLEFGPGRTPFMNGVRGAVAGIAFATCLQLASSIRGPELEGPLKTWVGLARVALADPIYAVARSTSQRVDVSPVDIHNGTSPDLLLFVGTLINAYFYWVVLGFLFGFVFHRIRGDDGVVKALVFAAGVAITFGISQLFAVSEGGVNLLRLVPVAVFLLLTGVAVFDARSLATRGVSPARLPDVYGFRTSLGYASVIGAAVSLAPVLNLVRTLVGK